MKGEERPKPKNKNKYREHLWRAGLRTAQQSMDRILSSDLEKPQTAIEYTFPDTKIEQAPVKVP